MDKLEGCGDNSCIFGAPGVMGTNGGCRCFSDMPNNPEARRGRRLIQRNIMMLKAEVAENSRQLQIVAKDRTDKALENTELRVLVSELQARISLALRIANRRWEEWGGRAVMVCGILEGEAGEGSTE